MKWAGEPHLERVRVAENSLLPDEITRREYGKVRAHMTGNGETGANVLRTYVAPVPCSNKEIVTI